MKHVICFFSLLCVFLCCCCHKKNEYKAQAEIPDNIGIDRAAGNEIFNVITGNRNVLSFIVLKDDYTLYEYYAAGANKDTVFRLNSCSKSVTSALIGIAIDQGLINGVDTKITEFFPGLGEEKSEITIKHLLTMTAGWDWPEWTTWNYQFGDWNYTPNKVQFVLEREQLRQPGLSFNYDTGATQLLCAIIEKVSGMPADEYARRNIFDKIGIKSARWSRDPQGVTDGGFGLSMTAGDALTFGKLYLNRGQWNGEQIIPEEWIAISTMEHSAGSGFFSPYGMHWWVDSIAARTITANSVTADKKYEMFYAMGFGGQYIFVVPELNMTAVFTCAGTDSIGPLRYFKSFVRAITE